MKNKKQLLSTLGIIFFSTGILVGMVIFILMNWANFEAYFYFGYIPPAEKTLSTLRCPLLMTTSDQEAVTADITNDTEWDRTPMIQTEISYQGTTRSERNNYPLAAGETRKLSWTVTSEDMVFGHLVLARVYVYRAFTLPSQAKTCGTVMVNLPGLTGIQLFVIVLAFSLACIGAGWGLWLTGSRPLQSEGVIATRAMSILTAIVLLGFLAGCFGWWVVGLLCTIFSVLMIALVGGYYIQKT